MAQRLAFAAAMILLPLCLLFIVAPSSARTAAPPKRMLICDSQAVPAGWVIVQRLGSWPPCGNDVGARWVEQLGAQRIQICEGQDLPAGYPPVQFAVSSICGTWQAGPGNFQFWGSWVLNKVGPKQMVICDVPPLPANYRVVQRVSSSICGAVFVGNNQWSPRDALLIEKF